MQAQAQIKENTSFPAHHSVLRKKGELNGYVRYGRPVISSGLRDMYVAKKYDFTHTVIAGGINTGVMNTTANHAVDNFRNGMGQVVIDSHADFSDDIIAVVSPNEIDRLGYFNPNQGHRARMNILDTGAGLDVSTRTQMIMDAFRTASPQTWDVSTQMHTLLGNAIKLTLIKIENPDISSVKRIMCDHEFRVSLLGGEIDSSDAQNCIEYWENVWDEKTDKDWSILLEMARKHLDTILTRDPIRFCVGMQGSTIALEDYLNNGKTLIACFDNRMGSKAKRIMGGMFIQQVLATIQKRQFMSSSDRPSSAMIVSDFYHFFAESSGALITMLSESRKSKHELMLATESLEQVVRDREVYDVVMNNTLTKLFFRMSSNEVQNLAVKALGTTPLTSHDIQALSNSQAYCALHTHNRHFSAALVDTSEQVQRHWQYPKGIGYKATSVNLPDPNWDGLTMATSSSLDSVNLDGGILSEHPADKLKYAHKMMRDNMPNNATKFLADLSDDDWEAVQNERRNIDRWQSKTIIENLSPANREDYIDTVKNVIGLRDGIDPLINRVALHRQNKADSST